MSFLDGGGFRFANAVGFLCGVAGIWCAFTNQLILGAFLALASLVLAGWIWMYLLKVHNNNRT
jgi:hypothetical protein